MGNYSLALKILADMNLPNNFSGFLNGFKKNEKGQLYNEEINDDEDVENNA